MTQNNEFNAATVEEAIEKASDSLGTPPEKLSYEILDPGSAGFLGMGSRDARIAITSDTATEENSDPTEEAADDQSDHSSVQSPPPPEDASSPSEEEPPAPEALLKDVETFVASSVDAMGFDARIDVYDAGDFIAVDVASSETGLFIGPKGETVDALQYLLNVTTYKGRPFVKRIVIDSEGYRQRRVEAVQGMAHRMARKAVREHRLVELPPMSSAERRIVHMFLKDNQQVNTASQGAGENRRVTVSPEQ